MSDYSKFTEAKKEKMREHHRKWAKKNPRTSYYKEYDNSRDTAYRLYRGARQRARDQNIPFKITRDDIIVPDNCPICNIKMAHAPTGGGNSASYTLDKVIPQLGYIKGNISVICKLCNSTKGSGDAELHRKIANYIDTHIIFSPWLRRQG